MKLICLNQDECGNVEALGEMSSEEIAEFSIPENLICKLCTSIALIYTDNYKPIFYEEGHRFLSESNALISLVHNLIKNNLKEG